MTLTEFLLARIAEDEQAARLSMSPAPWSVDGSNVVMRQGSTDTVILADYSANARDLAHIARHSPARVLAECEAKRRIVEEVAPHLERVEGHAIDGGMYDEDSPHALRNLLCLLALPYADHPDYRDEWRP